MQKAVFIEVQPDYEGYSRLLKVIANENVSVINTDFGDFVTVNIAVKENYFENFKTKLIDAFNGKITIDVKGNNYYNFG